MSRNASSRRAESVMMKKNSTEIDKRFFNLLMTLNQLRNDAANVCRMSCAISFLRLVIERNNMLG